MIEEQDYENWKTDPIPIDGVPEWKYNPAATAAKIAVSAMQITINQLREEISQLKQELKKYQQ